MAKIYYGNQEISSEQYIDSEHLNDNAVITSKIADNAVTGDKIADGAITDSKLASGVISEIDSKQDELISGENIKTVNGKSILGSGDLSVTTYQTFNPNWKTNGTTKEFCDDVNADVSAVVGMAYLGGVTFSDFPATGLLNADVVVDIIATTAGKKVIRLTLTSGSVTPYHWEYTYWNNGNNVSGWKSWQTPLTPGDNITINGSRISATDTTYSAGTGLSLDGTEFNIDTTVVATQDDLAGKQDVLTAGNNIEINNNEISATDTTYSAGNGLDLSGTEFSVDTTIIATQQDLSGKQDTLTAGSNIAINSNTISVNSSSATSGQVLTADGSGGASWQNASGSFENYVIITSDNVTLSNSDYNKLLEKNAVLIKQGSDTDNYYKKHHEDNNYIYFNRIDLTDSGVTQRHYYQIKKSTKELTKLTVVNAKTFASSVNSQTATLGQVLTADGNGGASWATAPVTDVTVNSSSVVVNGEAILGTAALCDSTVNITSESSELVTSGGVYTGLSNKMDKSNPTGTGSLSINRKADTTIGSYSTAVGNNCEASGYASFAAGASCRAVGNSSVAMGEGCKANKPYNIAFGRSSIADSGSSYDTAFAAGESVLALGSNSVALGEGTGSAGASGWWVKVVGDANATQFTILAGSSNRGANAQYIRPGDVCYLYDKGYAKVVSITLYSTESQPGGYITLDKALSTTAITSGTSLYIISAAYGNYSVAAGVYNTASASSALALNRETKAYSYNAAALGYNTIANKTSQKVFGEYNTLDTEDNPLSRSSISWGEYGRYVEIVGNGTSESARANARTLDWNGNEWLAGNLQFKSNSSTYKTTLQPSNLSTASADVTFTLPSDNGTSGQVLATDGSGNTSWQSTVNSLGGSTGVITFGPPLPALSAEFVVNANNQIVRNLHLYQHSVYVTATSVDCSLSFTFISTTSTPINIASALISVINAWLGTSTNGEGLAANGIYKVGTANHQQIVLIKGQGEGATSLKLVMFNSTGTVTERDLTESAITSVDDKVLIII